MQWPVAYSGPRCEYAITTVSPAKACIYSAIETQYFTGNQLSQLRFSDIVQNTYQAYQQSNVNNICPNGFTLVGNDCYLINVGFTYTWFEAKANCFSVNAQLAWFDNRTQFDQVRQWIQSKVSTPNSGVWVNGKLSNNIWVWDNNNAQIPSDLSWVPGKPNSANPLEDATLLSASNGYLISSDASGKRQYGLLCRRSSFRFNSTTATLNLVGQPSAIGSNGENLVGFTYQINVTEDASLIAVAPPTNLIYSFVYAQNPITYGTYYAGSVSTYSSPFVLTLCNDLTGSQIDQIKQILTIYWLQLRSEFTQCNCFNLYFVSVEKYTDTNNSPATRISYIGKANQLIIESNSTGALPVSTDVYNQLKLYGFSQCVPRVKRAAMLQLTVVSPSDQVAAEVQTAVKTALVAIQPTSTADIVTSDNGVDLKTNSPVTQYCFNVTVDGKTLDFTQQNVIDMSRLIQELNYQKSLNNIDQLTFLVSSDIFSRNYFFTLFSTSYVNKQQYSKLISQIKSIFLNTYPKFTNDTIKVNVPLQEKYLDVNRNIVYGLDIMININGTPADDIINLNRTIFNQIQTITSNNNVVYTFFVPTAYVTPLSKAVIIYSNYAITYNNIVTFENTVLNVFESYNSGSLF